jgi:hypothetical protein
MKRLLILGAISGLLVTMVSRCSAAKQYDSSHSNTGNFVLTYNPDIVNEAQATATLGDLEKMGERTVDETTLRAILKTHGVRTDRIKKVIIEAGKTGRKDGTIILLENPKDEAEARSTIDPNSGHPIGRRAH